ncbi:metal ABC transporter solute-binding protein, Zn/Mn family [Lentilactobacillus laojiaonis]|uniref:metal ABC transporter solute-binding protein, Zn/Mn family n=1 Tax=Lentilactobacillus laojiaonis TaxID=2883998 RepID=UPI001D0ADF14|nr:zinc ABC transporter substrate-binding protein [Lentilactobacillus laojiaonis]UDM32063.1 zinc ABC transporter substrate-binding protein [Lentilactobacillus laojiaonis]
MHQLKKSGLWLLGILSLGLFLAGCQQVRPKSNEIKVVASMDFYGSVAKEILGNHGTVSSLVDTTETDPHDFEPTTADAKKIDRANVIISNGLGYDTWMNRLSTDSSAKNIKVGETVMHKQSGDNEHIWYQPATMKNLANYLANQFSRLDPKHRSEYQNNAKRYIASFKQLDQTIAQAKRGVTNSRVDVTEPVFNYALENLGYQVNNPGFENAISKEVDPTPDDIKKMQTDFQHHKIAMLVDNTQSGGKIIDNLVEEARQNHIPILKITESMPKNETYLTWMQNQYDALIKIQKSSLS